MSGGRKKEGKKMAANSLARETNYKAWQII